MIFAGGALQLKKSDTQNGGLAGPNCLFSTIQNRIRISGKLCILTQCIDTFLSVEPTRFFFKASIKFFLFKWTVKLLFGRFATLDNKSMRPAPPSM